MINARFLTGSILAAAALASAHLGALTEPKAGSSYAAGSTLTVKWSVPQPHGTQDLAYSQDGSTWVNITTGLLNTVNTYEWTVPNKPSATTRFRVCQRDGGTGCTNAQNTQSLGNAISVGGGRVYTAVTSNFTISAVTGLAATATADLPRIAFDAATRNVKLSFRMEKAGRVLLEAFDTQGRLLATLLDTEKPEGGHSLSVFSHRLPAAGAVILRLQAGHQGVQETVGLGR
jgi:hypothetical protein